MGADSGGKPSVGGLGQALGARVRRRRLYYVAGFDPASPRKYHALFTAQSARQAAVSGARFTVGPLEPMGPIVSGWSVIAEHPGGERVEVDYRFLHWFDIVRQVWPKDGLGLYVRAWDALIDYFRRGIMRRALEQAPVVYLASLAPVVVSTAFILLYALAVIAAAGLGALAAQATGWPWWTGATPSLLLWLAVLWAWRKLDAVLPVGWIGRGMVCVTAAARGEIPGLDGRAEAFSRQILEALVDPAWDEVLVVGHSMGGQLVCSAVGKAVQADPRVGDGRLSLLTLGSLIPLYAMGGKDEAFRRDLGVLKDAERVFWLDVTSPSDPGSTAAIHPLAGLGLGEPERRPVRRSPRFHLMSPAIYPKLRRDPLGFHFQYLMATEVDGGYDFFRLTAGPDRLARTAEMS